MSPVFVNIVLLPLCQVHAMDMLLSASYIVSVRGHSIGNERKVETQA